MASERDLELLDDYLRNRLGAAEKTSFEKQLETDAALKREFAVQQRIIEGLKSARVAELKSMLNNVPVPAPVGQSLLVKLGIGAVVAGMIGTGAFFLFQGEPETPAEPKKEQVAAQESPILPKQSQDTVQPSAEHVVPEKTKTVKTAPAAAPHKKPAARKAQKPETASEPAVEAVQAAKPQVYDPTEEAQTDQPLTVQDISGGHRDSQGSSIVSEPVLNDKKHDFHYRFNAGKLFLYGHAFQDSGTYEIMEFFAGGKKPTTVILFYVNKYYLLKRESVEITPLTPITDAALLDKLKEYRKN